MLAAKEPRALMVTLSCRLRFCTVPMLVRCCEGNTVDGPFEWLATLMALLSLCLLILLVCPLVVIPLKVSPAFPSGQFPQWPLEAVTVPHLSEAPEVAAAAAAAAFSCRG